jgi:small subunit ribosomal protein S20
LSALPNIKSAKKWVRASEKRRKRNLGVKTRLKTIYKRAAAAGAAPAAAVAAASAFDKAAARGIIHKNKASRKKSRLAKRAAAKA